MNEFKISDAANRVECDWCNEMVEVGEGIWIERWDTEVVGNFHAGCVEPMQGFMAAMEKDD